MASDRTTNGDPPPAENSAHFAAVYDELKRLAQAVWAGQPVSHTLQPTALVHEAYLKLCLNTNALPADRAHFFRLAAKVMRQLLVDHARAKGRDKRSAPGPRVPIDAAALHAAPGSPLDLLDLHEALDALASLDERKAALVELRAFAGLSLDEAADALEISRATAARDWRFAQAWLQRRLDDPQDA